MEDDWNNWASIIRSCVLTSKTPLTPREINRDTLMLEGENIPYRKFNHRSLEDMLRKIPGLTVFQQNNDIYVKAIPSEETAHISKMVRLQKPKKKKPRTLAPVFNQKFFPPRTYRTPITKNVPQNKHNMPQNNRNNVPNNRPNSENAKRPTFTPNFQANQQSTPKPSTTAKSTPPTPPSTPSTPTMPVSTAVPTLRTPTTPVNVTAASTAPTKTVTFSTETQRLTPQQRLQAVKQMPTKNLCERLSAVQIEDPRLQLHNYTSNRSLPMPIYKDIPTKHKHIYSCVTVNKKKYSSYPHEATTKDEAEKIAARIALEDLMEKDKKPDTVTKDKELVVKRIQEIVNNHPNGLFESSVIECYTSKYNEALPKDWLKSVENFITIDIGANDSPILRPQKSTLHNVPTQKSVQLTEPEQLNLNNLNEFYFHVYVVYSTVDIWGILIDEEHSDKLNEFAKEMKTYYDTDNTVILPVYPGKYYTVYDTEWHRVKCVKYDQINDIATVFFIDRGDEDVFPAARLRILQPQFCKLPAQAIRLSLMGLEIFEDLDEVQTILEEELFEKSFFVRKRPNITEDKNTGIISELYTGEDVENEVLVNDIIKQKIYEIVDPKRYVLPDKANQEVYISHVSEGAIYIQLKSKGLKHLEKLLEIKAKDYLENSYFKSTLINKFDLTKIYITKTSDNTWLRVKITKIENENQAKAFCVDVGDTLTVKKQNLILLDNISEFLASYPEQAVLVRLHKVLPVLFDAKMAAHLREIAPKSKALHMKVIHVLENIPIVVFHKRTEDNWLASLNDTLVMTPEIVPKDDNNNAKRLRNERMFIATRTDFPLQSPNIPSIGSYFDVYVTMVAHPGNFTVQPLNTAKELEDLMTDLTKFCENYKGPALMSSNIKVGSMYAAKYDQNDGRWYRGYVSKVIDKHFCVVYYCDYGDYKAIPMEHLLPLHEKFYSLPYQALKAKLFGVTPVLKGDWSVADSLRFNELTVDKSFVSIVKSCDFEKHSTSGEMILGLELINTSTTENVYISNVLIKEKRANKA